MAMEETTSNKLHLQESRKY